MKNPFETLKWWAKNDPNPMKTLDLIKRKQEYNKKMVRENPMKLYKEIDPEGFKIYHEQMKDLRQVYWKTRGYSTDKNYKDNWMVPLVLWNLDPDYWHEVTRRKKNLVHTEFMVSPVKPQITKVI
jgi:hypothetical protein